MKNPRLPTLTTAFGEFSSVGNTERSLKIRRRPPELVVGSKVCHLAGKDSLAKGQKVRAMRVLVNGGGPAGLTFAINLAETGKAEIVVRDKRYERIDGKMVFGGPRRNQVVTLQCECLEALSMATRRKLNGEVVWGPGSRNLAIRQVEDQLLERAQDLAITLETGDSTDGVEGFDLVVGADGSKSPTRRLMGMDDVVSKGTDDALGIAFQIPEGKYPHGLPFQQVDNVLLTIAQRRYLLNASSIDRTGYLNMHLTPSEAALAVRADGQPCVFGRSPGYVGGDGAFKPQLDSPESPSGRLWKSILTGLALFGIDPRDVTSIVRIKINVSHSPRLVGKVGKAVAVLVGDAAFQTHFWPGRGMNSVLKEAAVLAYAVSNFEPTTSVQKRGRWRQNHALRKDLKHYEDFVDALRAREDPRSCAFLQSRGISRRRRPLLCRTPSIVDDLLASAERLGVDEARTSLVNGLRWPKVLGSVQHDAVRRCAAVLAGLDDDYEIKIMAASMPWPKTSGPEVLHHVGMDRVQRAHDQRRRSKRSHPKRRFRFRFGGKNSVKPSTSEK